MTNVMILGNHECCICLESVSNDNILILDCNHILHYSCGQTLTKCPLCRGEILEYNGNSSTGTEAVSEPLTGHTTVESTAGNFLEYNGSEWLVAEAETNENSTVVNFWDTVIKPLMR